MMEVEGRRKGWRDGGMDGRKDNRGKLKRIELKETIETTKSKRIK
jgi:hypothetical protein